MNNNIYFTTNSYFTTSSMSSARHPRTVDYDDYIRPLPSYEPEYMEKILVKMKELLLKTKIIIIKCVNFLMWLFK